MAAIGLCLLLVGIAPAADSLNVRLVGTIDTPGSAMKLALSGQYLYVADSDSGLLVISIADPRHPVEVGHCAMPSSVNDVVVNGSYAYVADGDSGLGVISIADPSHPVEVGHCYSPGGAWVAVSGDYAYLAGIGLRVISITDPTHPVEVAYPDSGETHDVDAGGSYVYVAAGASLLVFSVIDPTHPVKIGECSTFENNYGVTVNGEYAYCPYVGTFGIISVADPAHPSEVAWLYVGGPVLGVTVSGDYAYVACCGGLRVILVSDRANPIYAGHYWGTSDRARDVAVAGNLIYVAQREFGIEICEFYGGGVEENPRLQAVGRRLEPTVIRSLPRGAVAFDAMGRRALNPKPGVYFVRDEGLGAGYVGRTRKIVITR